MRLALAPQASVALPGEKLQSGAQVQTSSGAGRASRSRSASTASRIEAGVARVAAEGRGEGVELFAEAERDQLGL